MTDQAPPVQDDPLSRRAARSIPKSAAHRPRPSESRRDLRSLEALRSLIGYRLAPGKRIRPKLSVLAIKGAGCADGAAVDAGCAIELVHTASLVLDDLPAMHDAEFRRGQLCARRRYGESTAILSSIAMLNRAFGLPSSKDGVDVAGMEQTDLDHLGRVGQSFGLAFQTAADILDAQGTREEAGKAVRLDGTKPTFVSVAGLDGARRRVAQQLEEARETLQHCAFDTVALLAVVGGFERRSAGDEAMAPVLANLSVVGVTVLAMEVVATLVHRHPMHGIGWGWDRSHHEPHDELIERNDLFAVCFAALPTLRFVAGAWAPVLRWISAGTVTYGVLYFAVHDGLVQQCWPFRWRPRRSYLKHLVQAHRLHHAVQERDGAVSFGFLYAPPPDPLIARLRVQAGGRRA